MLSGVAVVVGRNVDYLFFVFFRRFVGSSLVRLVRLPSLVRLSSWFASPLVRTLASFLPVFGSSCFAFVWSSWIHHRFASHLGLSLLFFGPSWLALPRRITSPPHLVSPRLRFASPWLFPPHFVTPSLLTSPAPSELRRRLLSTNRMPRPRLLYHPRPHPTHRTRKRRHALSSATPYVPRFPLPGAEMRG